jgi:hypothetical protein
MNYADRPRMRLYIPMSGYATAMDFSDSELAQCVFRSIVTAQSDLT